MIFFNIFAVWGVEKSDFQSDKFTIFSESNNAIFFLYFQSDKFTIFSESNNTIFFLCNNVSKLIVHNSQVFKNSSGSSLLRQ